MPTLKVEGIVEPVSSITSSMKPSTTFFTITCFLVLSLSFKPAKAPSPQQLHKKLSKLDRSIEDILKYTHCPGVAVVIVKKDQIIYAKGFGYRDFENKIPVTTNTLFSIGSCTKAFTSTLIGQLAEEDKVDLDESPRKYLPELTFYNDELNRMVTIRDMLCHRTGLPRNDLSWYYFPTDSRDSLLQRVQYHEPSMGPREGFQYNNFMYAAVGVISGRVTNQSWEEAVQNQLLNPLEMHHSNLSIEALEKADDFAFGYTVNAQNEIKKESNFPVTSMGPSGSINSNVNDMANWLITWINGGTFKGEQVIPKSFIYEATSSQMIASGSGPGNTHPDLHFANYGLGWYLSSYRGHYRVAHGGNIDGFSASTCFFPSDSIGIVVLANQDRSRVPSMVRNVLMDEMLGLTPAEWIKPLKEQYEEEQNKVETDKKGTGTVSNNIQGTSPSHPLADYTGKFNYPGYGTIRVKEKEGELYAHLPNKKWWLRHKHYDVFEAVSITPEGVDTSGYFSFNFLYTPEVNGDINTFSIAIEGGIEPFVFKRSVDILSLEVA